MPSVYQDITLYEDQGALLGLGPNQIVSFSEFQSPTTGHLRVEDDNTDFNWDVGETAEFQGQPATLIAAGTAVAGVSLNIPFVIDLSIELSSPVLTGIVVVDGVQHVRFYDAAGNDVDPAALLDSLVSDLTAAIGPVLLPLVLSSLGVDLLTYVETNAILTFDLSSANSVDLIPCFTAGTLIATERGEVMIETLKLGDRVLTVDHGLQAIRWIGPRSLTPSDLARAPHLTPIRIAAGAFAPDLPHQDLTVSPQHRCLVRSKIAARIAGEAEVLIAAKHLLGTPGVSVLPADMPVTYVHILFDRHELVWSNGAVTESLYLGEQAMQSVDTAARDEILALFPALADHRPPAARPFLRGRLARKLIERSTSNRKPLIEPLPPAAKVLRNA